MLLVASIFSCKKDKVDTEEKETIIPPKPTYEYGYKLDDYLVIKDTIKSGESFGQILDRHHVYYPKINKIATSIKDIFDVRMVRAGKPYVILAKKDSTEKAQVFIYNHDRINATIVDFRDSIIKAERFKRKVTIQEKTINGVIYDNFSFTMDSLKQRPNLTWAIADIYAWTVDFTKLQRGDRFKVVFEEKFIDDTIFAGYGDVKSMVFKHKGNYLYAFRYVTDSTKKSFDYYNEKGEVLRRQFLQAPIKFQYRISSRYNLNRRIAYYGNKVRPHKGTDFAAALGTPIIATANGTVVESEHRGGNGNYVKIKHNSTYSTQYLHMSKRKVQKGEYVRQGDVIGWVGMTGNTSGPHVCYRFWKHGVQVDPLREKMPSSEPLPAGVREKYLKYIEPLKYHLDNKKQPVKENKELKEIVAKN